MTDLDSVIAPPSTSGYHDRGFNTQPNPCEAYPSSSTSNSNSNTFRQVEYDVPSPHRHSRTPPLLPRRRELYIPERERYTRDRDRRSRSPAQSRYIAYSNRRDSGFGERADWGQAERHKHSQAMNMQMHSSVPYGYSANRDVDSYMPSRSSGSGGSGELGWKRY
jgi:hypothetical protein